MLGRTSTDLALQIGNSMMAVGVVALPPFTIFHIFQNVKIQISYLLYKFIIASFTPVRIMCADIMHKKMK
jgi:hypothetical protein